MHEATTLPLTAEEREALSRQEPPPAPRMRAFFLILFFLMPLAISVWGFHEVSKALDLAGPHIPPGGDLSESITRIQRFKWAGSVALLVFGGLTFVTIRAFFSHLDRLWERSNEECRISWESTAMRLRTQLAEKITSEDQLRKSWKELESRFSTLTHVHDETLAELESRKSAERNLTQQRSELARSKNVLQVHVQARSEELQKLQRQYELILNSAGEGICGFDSQGRVTFANPTAARILELEIKDIVGKKESEVFKSANTAQAAPPDGGVVELNLSRLDGSTFSAEYVRSIISENNRTLGHVVLFKDITQRRQSELALAHKAAELARSNAELEQFAFVASHDLQEPLRKIRAFGDRLKMKCETALSGDGTDYLDRMQNAAARMQTLINDLLTFSRVISRTEAFAPVDLNTVTREVLSDLEVRVEKSEAKVEVGELPVIQGDAMQMRQLMQNLIGNALKFHPPGAKPVVQIRSRTLDASPGDEPTCEITIQDNGIGFDEQYLEKIFAVFQRLHGRQEYEGTGVGLAVCRRITDRHKGSITAQSKPGAGATFVVTLPLAQKLT